MGNYRKNYFQANPSDHGWYTCVGCGRRLRKGDVEIDHILPQAWGGTDEADNLQCMCRHCNASKGKDASHTVDDYLWNQVGDHPGHEVDDMINEAADNRKSFFSFFKK